MIIINYSCCLVNQFLNLYFTLCSTVVVASATYINITKQTIATLHCKLFRGFRMIVTVLNIYALTFSTNAFSLGGTTKLDTTNLWNISWFGRCNVLLLNLRRFYWRYVLITRRFLDLKAGSILKFQQALLLCGRNFVPSISFPHQFWSLKLPVPPKYWYPHPRSHRATV